jgi:hypothetical protein
LDKSLSLQIPEEPFLLRLMPNSPTQNEQF